MGEETEFLATLIVQDGIKDKDLGKRYLIQVDTKGDRFFIDATKLILRVLDGTLPKGGEYWIDGSMENPKEK